jgi:hypothetical protein
MRYNFFKSNLIANFATFIQTRISRYERKAHNYSKESATAGRT